MSKKHLWDHTVKRPFHYPGYSESFSNWKSFLEEWGDADMDYNLLFRFGWEGDTLKMLFAMQRRGGFTEASVQVEKADESAIRAFLEPRGRHLIENWAPLTGHTDGHLWDVERYPNSSSSYRRRAFPNFACWLAEDTAGPDLLYGFDWEDDRLSLFFESGETLPFYHEIDVTPEDEPAVKEWLSARLKELMALWSPLGLTS